MLRRVYFDLIGLPPTPEEIKDFENDRRPTRTRRWSTTARRHSIRRTLGAHWLDLARFAESDGFAIDGERPTAWRYRDYVIRSFNQDKPYDRFVREQLAGDELPRRRKGGGADRSERLVALGFLRMGTWEADANFKTPTPAGRAERHHRTVGQVFLGLQSAAPAATITSTTRYRSVTSIACRRSLRR